jgi:hypothetical protein
VRWRHIIDVIEPGWGYAGAVAAVVAGPVVVSLAAASVLLTASG